MTLTLEPDLKKLDPLKLRAARERWKWTIDDLVYETRRRKMPVSRNTIISLESGESQGRTVTLIRLAETLGIRVLDDLFSETAE